MIMGFSEKGFKPDSFTMKIDGTRSKSCDCFFEKLHLVITLSGNVNDLVVAEVIQDTMMHNALTLDLIPALNFFETQHPVS